ncbi:hypothetical protein [Puniceibacterium sp. IMCC21224]|uniref:hypothetical protein n=1 Tax=Puniceibacterium sp. IMCC21224 TaxID=1618204 RepID=UPI00064E1221|nr:hypothetical protein [Puniceibacterium sp. IMCC21224]KMK66914.1 hypothetical protein IMCC21224_111773 [Puniceibacterium sp. IMCC21224]
MAQIPASPKLKRAALLAAAVTFGPELSCHGAALVASERAALELRLAMREHARPKAQIVTFLIPLVGAHHVRDWAAVSARLATTLQSLLNQTNPNWRAVICCQTRPTLPDDPRITHLPFDDPTPGNDKWRKLAALCDHLGALEPIPGYVMSFDADDLLHRAAVAEMLERQARGYLVQSGYVMDYATGAIALADAPNLSRPLRKPFWKLCGSCTALYHDPQMSEGGAFLRAMTQHEHRMFPYLARLAGHRLSPLSRPAVLYVLNHGENFGARRGRVGFKTRFVERFRITAPATLSEIAADFPAP